MQLNLSFFKSANIYLFGSIIQNAIPFLALPIITTYIVPADYSYVAMFILLISVFGAFIGLNAHGAIGRKWMDRLSMDFDVYVGNVIIVFLFSLIFAVVFTYICVGKVEKYISLDAYWIFVALYASTFQFLINIYLSVLQMQNKSLSYVAMNVTRSISNTMLILLLVVCFHKEWEGYLYAMFIIYALFGSVSFILVYKATKLKIVFNYKYFMHIIKFGLPLIIHTLGGVAIAMTDRLLLVNIEGREQAGIYQFGWQMALPMSIIVEAFKNSYITWLFEKLKSGTLAERRKVAILTYIVFIVSTIIAIALLFILEFSIRNFFNKQYIGSIQVINWLVFAFVINGAYYMVGLIISYAERTSLLAIITLVSGVLNLLFSYYLIIENGMVGAAQGTFFAYLLTFLLTWMLSAKVYGIPWLSFWKRDDN